MTINEIIFQIFQENKNKYGRSVVLIDFKKDIIFIFK